MEKLEDAMRAVEKCCGGGKDNVISLATLAAREDGRMIPVVRDVDALYEDGVFYVTTYGLSGKMRQIAGNGDVAYSVHFAGISGTAVGENLGWVMKRENAALRGKLRAAFADWYDAANNEQDENCVILAVRMKTLRLFMDHGAVQGFWTM